MAKMKEYSRAYNKEAISMALSLMIIHCCKDCGHPVRDGYECTVCGSKDPKLNKDSSSDIEV